ISVENCEALLQALDEAPVNADEKVAPLIPAERIIAVGRSVLVFVIVDSDKRSERTKLNQWHGGKSLIQAMAAQKYDITVVYGQAY
ncbi:glycoside hydrolase family 3 protein, partial [Moniliophthora roreri]